MELRVIFEEWRQTKGPEKSWGLSWFLAAEICRRFYASHGIVPWVICHDGMGYYGISLHKLPCLINGSHNETLGRFSCAGNAENWLTGGEGHHHCKLIELCLDGASVKELVAQAIAHFRLPAYPEKSHLACRHKRWGASYQLCFDIAAMVAMRCEEEEIAIWNHPAHTKRVVAELDDNHTMKEYPGVFWFSYHNQKLCLRGDGSLLAPTQMDLWEQYMLGQSVFDLSNLIIKQLKSRQES
ncbi:MAG: hypothetical protein ACRC6S_05185 [Shewanella sp.]